MIRVVCACGHDVDSHGVAHCQVCGKSCAASNSPYAYAASFAHELRFIAQLAAAEADKQLVPVVINEERRTA